MLCVCASSRLGGRGARSEEEGGSVSEARNAHKRQQMIISIAHCDAETVAIEAACDAPALCAAQWRPADRPAVTVAHCATRPARLRTDACAHHDLVMHTAGNRTAARTTLH